MRSTLLFDSAVGTAITAITGWAAAPTGVADNALGIGTVAQDATGRYLGPSNAVVASGDYAPDRQPFRLSLVADLSTVGAGVRVLAACVDSGAYIEVYALRESATVVSLAVFATEARIGLSRTQLAYSLVTAGLTGLLTVEAGPRFVRAWWDAGLTTFDSWARRTPDCGAPVPEIETLTWGLTVETGGKVRELSVGTDAAATIRDGTLTVTTSGYDPDDSGTGRQPRLPQDDSVVALARYAVVDGTGEEPVVLVTTAGVGATGNLADEVFRRLDFSQTLFLIAGDESTTVWVSSGGVVSGPKSSGLVVYAGSDPVGPDVGIGSGRQRVDVGGELVFEIGEMLQGSGYGYEILDLSSDSQPGVFDYTTTTVGRTWSVVGALRRSEGARMERLVGLHGSGRPIWATPSLEVEAIPVIMGGVQVETSSARRVAVTTELRGV